MKNNELIIQRTDWSLLPEAGAGGWEKWKWGYIFI